MTNIFIANLDFDITSNDLRATFSQFGEVHYAHVVFDNKTKRSKGFGYVEMENTDHAIAAIEALNGLDVNGRKLDVKIASPKGSRPAKTENKKAPEFKKPFKPKPNYSKVSSSNNKSQSSSNEEPKRTLRPRRKRIDK